MSEDEINVLLERYDQTTPALQRQIVARLVKDRAELLAYCEEELDRNKKRLDRVYRGSGVLPYLSDRENWLRAIYARAKGTP